MLIRISRNTFLKYDDFLYKILLVVMPFVQILQNVEGSADVGVKK